MAQKKKLTKQRARESLESQIDLSQREAKKELIKGRKVESYKNQVFFLEFQKIKDDNITPIKYENKRNFLEKYYFVFYEMYFFRTMKK